MCIPRWALLSDLHDCRTPEASSPRRCTQSKGNPRMKLSRILGSLVLLRGLRLDTSSSSRALRARTRRASRRALIRLAFVMGRRALMPSRRAHGGNPGAAASMCPGSTRGGAETNIYHLLFRPTAYTSGLIPLSPSPRRNGTLRCRDC